MWHALALVDTPGVRAAFRFGDRPATLRQSDEARTDPCAGFLLVVLKRSREGEWSMFRLRHAVQPQFVALAAPHDERLLSVNVVSGRVSTV